MSAPSETQKWTVPSEKIPGVEYDVTSRVIEDACNECGDGGRIEVRMSLSYQLQMTP